MVLSSVLKGVLPLEILDISLHDQAEAIFSNALQILAQFKVNFDFSVRYAWLYSNWCCLELFDNL